MSTYTVINPATALPVKDIELADIALTDATIAKAQKAFESWRSINPGDRAKLLRNFARVVDEHIEELAQLEVLNSGHTIGNARWEAASTITAQHLSVSLVARFRCQMESTSPSKNLLASSE